MNEGKLYINGEWIKSEKYFTSLNPNNGKVYGSVCLASKNDVDAAVNAARMAFPSWKTTSIDHRSKILHNAAKILIEEYGEPGKSTALKQLISDEVGKRLPEADVEVIESSDMISFFADKASSVLGSKEITLNQTLWPTKQSKMTFEPVGVVAVIKAWNYPLEVPIWAIAPALMAGNTVVFKPSEKSSFVAIELVKIFEKAGLPKGVLNLVTGDSSTGEFLSNHINIDLISFTGSLKVGREISINSSKRFVRSCLELSGNDAAIVESDADLELTANGLVWGAFCNSGQVCVGVKRAFVNKNIANELTKLIVEKTNALREKIDYGPLISEEQLLKMEDFISDALKKGAKLLSGGIRLSNESGFYFKPTVISNVTSSMKLMKEECFGILLPIIEVENTDEALALSNTSEYGLGASVWTSNLENGEKIANRLQAGMVWINDVNVAFPEAPWGGIKGSGHGIDLSEFGFHEYVNVKHISTELSQDKRRIWWYPY